MALVNVVSCKMDDNELCKKYPSTDLRIGSQLIVYPSQIAFFVKGGTIYDEFEAGAFTLKSSNIPLLNKVINLPYGGESPFKAEVWFINLTTKLDLKWGTNATIQLEDPKYNIIVPVGGFGQYGIRVIDPKIFLKTLIGNMSDFSAQKVDNYFKGKMMSLLNSLIARKIASDKISILEINTHLVEMSEYCNREINNSFEKYGLELVDFSIVSITFPEDDPSIIKLKEAKDLAARLKIAGKDVYQMERSFNVLETAAGNEGMGGQMVGVGAGLGVGMGVGSAMGNMASQMINTNPIAPPPLPQETLYHVYLNGQQLSGITLQNIIMFIRNGMMSSDTLVWKPGQPQWVNAIQIPEIASMFNQQAQQVPPLPPQI